MNTCYLVPIDAKLQIFTRVMSICCAQTNTWHNIQINLLNNRDVALIRTNIFDCPFIYLFLFVSYIGYSVYLMLSSTLGYDTSRGLLKG